MRKTTAEWVQKAEEDLALARLGSRSKIPVHSDVAFLCQQAAEKYLKALMEELGLAVSRFHDLNRLRAALLPHHPSLRGLGRGLRFLTGFAVTPRYPGDRASKRQAAAALRWAGRVRTAARGLLGIRQRRSGRRK